MKIIGLTLFLLSCAFILSCSEKTKEPLNIRQGRQVYEEYFDLLENSVSKYSVDNEYYHVNEDDYVGWVLDVTEKSGNRERYKKLIFYTRPNEDDRFFSKNRYGKMIEHSIDSLRSSDKYLRKERANLGIFTRFNQWVKGGLPDDKQ